MHQFRRFMLNCVFKSQRKLLRQSLNSSKWISTVEQPPSEKIQFSIPNGNLGQPTYHTHPHLISEGHLTCGVTQIEYKNRRTTLINKLMAEVGNALNNHIIVIPAAQKLYMSDKIPYVFRQNSDFFYLTGCMEPAAILVLIKPAQTENYKSMLFVHDKDPHAELWEGPRTGCGAAVELFAVDEALPVDDFHEFITQFISSVRPTTLWYHKDNPVHSGAHDTLRRALAGGAATHADPTRALHLMRLVKSPAEVQLMRDACRIGAEAVRIAMACTRPGVTEHELTALLDYSSRRLGAEHPAFPPVVAGGSRATHIHYIANLQRLRAGELLLVDAGCQRWLYNSDLTRTWPVSGKFSNHQQILYEIVLAVQKRLIALMNETRAPLDRLFEQMCRLLGTTLQQEGILPRDIDNKELFSRAYRLCPHHVSHYLGLDVHDTPSATRRLPLQPGMVVTVEPGLYIREDDTSVPPEFRGIGIRIEDDVLITEEDVLVLTDACPKEVDAIENIVGTYDMNSWAATS